MSIDKGAHIDLSTIHTTVHVGAHADAPAHYVEGGATIEQRPLHHYMGRCQVVDVRGPRGRRICRSDISVSIQAPRILFHTGSFPDPNAWNADFSALEPALIEWLHDHHGVHLVGLDTPSIDLSTSKALPSHAAVAARDMAILEGVVLNEVPAGCYTLVALPLPLAGADASPVRAVLLDGPLQ
jgi:arylformamidase